MQYNHYLTDLQQQKSLDPLKDSKRGADICALELRTIIEVNMAFKKNNRFAATVALRISETFSRLTRENISKKNTLVTSWREINIILQNIHIDKTLKCMVFLSMHKLLFGG